MVFVPRDINQKFMSLAVGLSLENIESSNGGPFGAVIAKDGNIIAEGVNEVTGRADPTAHAEVVAIRRACQKLGSYDLAGCTLYTSCEPCPMCLGAIYWARLDAVYYAATRSDAARAGFDDALIYDEISKPPASRTIPFTHTREGAAQEVFEKWINTSDKIPY